MANVQRTQEGIVRLHRNVGHWLVGATFRGPQRHVYVGWWVISWDRAR